MAKYVLIYSGGGMPENEAAQAAAMEAWGAWYGSIGAGVVDYGNPFTPIGKRVAGDGAVSDVTPAALASGYSIITADSFDAAVAIAQRCPILKDNGQVSVYEAFDMA
jgi:hypothetical protein